MADAQLGSYSPEEVTVTISVAGVVHTLSGFSDQTFINITRLVPASEAFISADLAGGRVKRRNRSALATFSLSQYSSSNDFMQRWQLADEQASRGQYVGSITVKDNSGTSLFFSNQAVITTTPDYSLSTTTEYRDWEVFMFNTSGAGIGGNSLIDDSTVQAIEGLGGFVEDRWKLNG